MQVRATDPMGFAISPVIPNRPIALEVDRGRQQQMLCWLLVGALVVAAALFDAWQRYGILSHGFQLEAVQTARAAEEVKARYLQLEIETLRAPAHIEALARGQLHLVSPGPEDVVFLERVVPPEQPPSSVVASR
jgi:cell division protein FtsL